MIDPHGGELVDKIVNEDRAEHLQSTISDGPVIELNTAEYQDVINISNGRYSPLKGYMTRNDFLKVVHDMTLEDGTIWPLPIILDVSQETASELNPGEKAGLIDPSGRIIGAIDIDEVYKYNDSDVAEGVFGTDDPEHPGVQALYNRDDFLVGGEILVFDEERYNGVDLFPKETRVLFEHRGWNTVVGFQTRNAPHRAHEYIQKSALELADGLLVQPKLGEKKDGDYRDKIILDAYQSLLQHYYPNDRVSLSVFPSKMNYAGPREAIFDAIVRKNQGCTHFIIGRDHAGVGDYYGGFEAQRIFQEIGDLGITPLFYNYSFYCRECDGMASEKICPHSDEKRVYPSGTKIRNMIQSGSRPSEKIMRPEVTECIMSADTPFIDHSKQTETQL
ncbi:MAG: sulfate adenylyltransferase [Halobacteriaceae archaeon]